LSKKQFEQRLTNSAAINALDTRSSEKRRQARPSDYQIDCRNPEIGQALADLIEMGLVVDSGQRKFQNGRWQIVWVAVPEAELGTMQTVVEKNDGVKSTVEK